MGNEFVNTGVIVSPFFLQPIIENKNEAGMRVKRGQLEF